MRYVLRCSMMKHLEKPKGSEDGKRVTLSVAQATQLESVLLSLWALVQHTLQELEPRIPQQALVRYALQELAHKSSTCTDATAAAGAGSNVFHHKCWHIIHRKGWFGLCLLRRQERTTSCRYRCLMMASTIWLQ